MLKPFQRHTSEHGTKDLLLELLKEVKLLRKDAALKGDVLSTVLETVETVRSGVQQSGDTIVDIRKDTSSMKQMLRKSGRVVSCKHALLLGLLGCLFVYFQWIWTFP
jgi:hypothetical protein